MRVIVIIPVRMDSKRLPGKPLMQIDGKSVIWNCYCSALGSRMKEVSIASSDTEILWEVCKNGGGVIETSNNPVNGTERVAEAARILQLAPDDIVVNLQGDMPFFNPEIIIEPVKKLKAIPECNVASAMTFLRKEDKKDLSRVKVIVDKQGKAIDFSREYGDFLHIGVYVFRNAFLQKYAEYGVTDIEIEMQLEQKRLDFMNEYIWMSFVQNRPVVIDTEEDLKNARCK